MGKTYTLFDYQSIIANLKGKHTGDEEYEGYNKFLDGVNKDSSIEDTPFFQDYLSRFGVEKAFEGYNLTAEEKTMATKDDLFLLFRLIIASFSSTYEILYDKPSNSIDLSITVTKGEQTQTEIVAELFSFQIELLFEVYIGEQIRLYTSFINPIYKHDFNMERKMRLIIFDKKVRQLRDQQEADGLLSDLDDVLDS